MRDFRNDIRAQATAFGRNPDHIKLMFLIAPIIDVSMEAAQAREQARLAEAESHIEFYLANMSRVTGIDFSKYDLDEKLPELTSNGHVSAAKGSSGRTPREIVRQGRILRDVSLVGVPDVVSAVMAEVMDAVGGDGFLIMDPNFTRRDITEIADGLTPALQKLGVVRKKYEFAMLRDNLRAF